MKRVPPSVSHAKSFDRTAEPRKLVLYVEDDKDNRQTASLRLARKYELLFAASDREVCALVRRHGTRLSIILMDIELQGSTLNGVDLTRLLRGKLDRSQLPDYAVHVEPQPDTPILFVTAYGQRYQRDTLISAGGDEIIHKPIDFVALHTAMARVYVNRV